MKLNNVWENTTELECYLKDVVDHIVQDGRKCLRHVWNIEALTETCRFILEEFRHIGFEDKFIEAIPFDAWFWKSDKRDVHSEKVTNLVVQIPGESRPDEIVIVGAHYDSRVGMTEQRGKLPNFHLSPNAEYSDTPGANDNGSGIAALLALARAFCGQHLDRTLRLVAWVNEEFPFYSNYWVNGRERDGETFYAEGMGSYVHAKGCRDRGENIIGVVSLDTLGIYADSGGLNLAACKTLEKPLIQLSFPNRRNYVAFLSNYPSSSLAKRFWETYCKAHRASFGGGPGEDPEAHAIVRWFPLLKSPRKGCHLSLRSLLSGISTPLRAGWSDDWAYWQFDYPAFIVTDTAYLRSATYHSIHDTKDVINFSEFTKVVWTLRQAIIETLVGLAP